MVSGGIGVPVCGQGVARRTEGTEGRIDGRLYGSRGQSIGGHCCIAVDWSGILPASILPHSTGTSKKFTAH
jgi:hypothetical protein